MVCKNPGNVANQRATLLMYYTRTLCVSISSLPQFTSPTHERMFKLGQQLYIYSSWEHKEGMSLINFMHLDCLEECLLVEEDMTLALDRLIMHGPEIADIVKINLA